MDRAEETLKRIVADTRILVRAAPTGGARAGAGHELDRRRFVPSRPTTTTVARAAVNSAGTIGGDDFFVPTLVTDAEPSSQGAGAQGARRHGEAVVPTLAYFLGDNEEDIWVRRHVPATLARTVRRLGQSARIRARLDGFLRSRP